MAENKNDDVNAENKAVETPSTQENQSTAPKKEQKPINFKSKYIALGVLGVVLVVAIVLACVFLT